MRTTPRFLGALAAALLCVALLGACGDGDGAQSVPIAADDGTGEDDGGGGDNGGGDNGGGDNGGGDNGGGGGAPGAPIDIPSFQQDQGRPLADVLADIEETVREQCGGELCIEIRVEMADDGFTECTFVATDPPQGSQVERGGTLLVIAGTEPCEVEGTEGEGTDNGETEGEGTDNGETEGEGTDNGETGGEGTDEGEETDGGGTDDDETDGSGTDDGGSGGTP